MKRGAIFGVICGIGFVMILASMIRTTQVTACLMCVVGGVMCAVGCMGMAIEAWGD